MAIGRKQYPFDLIEPKWQAHWERQQTFRAWNPGEALPVGHPFAARHKLEGKTPTAAELPPKHYILDMFPYPSGAGLHVGHPEGYTATDILSRYRRAAGFNVLHPMGWDAFGLPAEQYAIKTGQHPRKTTEANIATFKRQIKSLGFSYDWSREVDTTDPKYFKWTQWIFLKLYNSYYDPSLNKAMPIALMEDALSQSPKRESEWKSNHYLCQLRAGIMEVAQRKYDAIVVREFVQTKRLAYVSEAPVNWCPELGTVLANEEEVIDGKSEGRRLSSCAAGRCGNGCFASRPMPSDYSMIWKASTGAIRSRKCSGIGLAGARARRWILQLRIPKKQSACSQRDRIRSLARHIWCYRQNIDC